MKSPNARRQTAGMERLAASGLSTLPVASLLPATETEAERRARKARWAEEMLERLYLLAMEGNREETQKAAAEALLNRLQGMPVARNLNANTDDISRLSDGDLIAELARAERATAAAGAGTAETDLPA